MAKTERLQLRVSAEFKELLERLAAADNRSVTNYIERLVYFDMDYKKYRGERFTGKPETLPIGYKYGENLEPIIDEETAAKLKSYFEKL